MSSIRIKVKIFTFSKIILFNLIGLSEFSEFSLSIYIKF